MGFRNPQTVLAAVVPIVGIFDNCDGNFNREKGALCLHGVREIFKDDVYHLHGYPPFHLHFMRGKGKVTAAFAVEKLLFLSKIYRQS